MPLEIVRNDITRMQVDAIVNAANCSLLGGGGVDGAIHRAAGPELTEACRALHGCQTGQAKLTKGYNLPCKYVIHTVGPVWQGGQRGERALLAACYEHSLALALAQGCETVAFPLISTGAYGYPRAEAFQVAVEVITRFLLEQEMTVYLVVFDKETLDIGGKLFHDIAAYIDDVYVARHADPWELAQRRSLAGATLRNTLSAQATMACPPPLAAPEVEDGLRDRLDRLEESFSQMLLRLIDRAGISDAACYKRANIDRRLFNKIKNNRDYQPSKQTVLAFAIALRLSLAETNELLEKAGYALSHSSKVDIVVEYCITREIYQVIAINQVLFQLDLPPLGY